MPLNAGALMAIKSEQFLNKTEMVNFTIQEIKLNEKRMFRFMQECSEAELTSVKPNPLIVDLIRWINDSYGLLLSHNKNAKAIDVCQGIWKKLHYTKHRTSPVPVSSKIFKLG